MKAGPKAEHGRRFTAGVLQVVKKDGAQPGECVLSGFLKNPE